MSQTLGELLKEHQNEPNRWAAVGYNFENDFGTTDERLSWWINRINNFQSGALMQRNAKISGADGSRSIFVDMEFAGDMPLLNETLALDEAMNNLQQKYNQLVKQYNDTDWTNDRDCELFMSVADDVMQVAAGVYTAAGGKVTLVLG
jgi:hypothetical protein